MRLRVEGLRYRYPSGVEALSGIELEINSGEAVAIVGANGAGKTTLVKHFNGLLRPTEGKVYVGDWDAGAHTVAELSTRVAFAFQNPEDQIFKSKVRDEVAFGPRNLGLSDAHVGQRVEEALELLGLTDAEDTHPYDLNPADRKLLTLASAIAMNTPVTIFDEPTAGQDGISLAQISGTIRTLKERDRTVILISNDLDFCAENLDKAILIHQGMAIEHGPIAEVLADHTSLNRAGLDPPQLVRLASEIGMATAPMDAKSFIDDYVFRENRGVERS